MARCAEIDELLRVACEDGSIPGAVATVADRHGLWHRATVGWTDPSQSVAMREDSIFRLASMTKLITAVAVMRLVDEGRVALDDLVARHLPEFESLSVLVGFDADVPVVRPAAGSATVRQLLAHTSGLSYEVWNADVLRYQQVTGTPAISSGRIGVLDTPLVADPGTTVEYGTGFDWAGRLVERVAGVGLDEFCRRELFEPLGMGSTSLRRLPEATGRYVPVLARGADGFSTTEIDYPLDADFATGGGCFYATAEDFLALQRALLAGGALGATRILSPGAVAEILRAQSTLEAPALRSVLPWLSADVDLGPGWRWGFGVLVNDRLRPGARAAHSAGWWGIFNTTFWIDRASGIAANLFMQFVPFHCPAAATVAASFERAVYASLSR